MQELEKVSLRKQILSKDLKEARGEPSVSVSGRRRAFQAAEATDAGAQGSSCRVPDGQHGEASGAAASGTGAQGQQGRPVPDFRCMEEVTNFAEDRTAWAVRLRNLKACYPRRPGDLLWDS